MIAPTHGIPRILPLSSSQIRAVFRDRCTRRPVGRRRTVIARMYVQIDNAVGIEVKLRLVNSSRNDRSERTDAWMSCKVCSLLVCSLLKNPGSASRTVAGTITAILRPFHPGHFALE